MGKEKEKMVLFIVIAIITGALGVGFLLFTDVFRFAGLMFFAPTFWALVTASKEYKKLKENISNSEKKKRLKGRLTDSEKGENMVNEKIVEEAKKAFDAGKSEEEVKKLLKGVGYSQEETEKVVKKVKGSSKSSEEKKDKLKELMGSEEEPKTSEKKKTEQLEERMGKEQTGKKRQWMIIGGVGGAIAIVVIGLLLMGFFNPGKREGSTPRSKIKSLMEEQCTYLKEGNAEALGNTYYPPKDTENILFEQTAGAITDCSQQIKEFKLGEDNKKATVEAQLTVGISIFGQNKEETSTKEKQFIKKDGEWYESQQTTSVQDTTTDDQNKGGQDKTTTGDTQDGGTQTTTSYNVVQFPVDGNAWGYEGWGNCDSQTGNWEDIDQFCKCKGYTGAVKKENNPCYHDWGGDRPKWEPDPTSSNCINSYDDKGPGRALTKVKCKTS